ncbi:MAG: alpha/beta fold hydrolase [Planctomycetia bacterium]|jgi:alpha-beta hydrolase superfamily lysophospholipase
MRIHPSKLATIILLVMATLLIGPTMTHPAWGQTKPQKKDDSKEKPPEPIDKIFDTADGVRLHATFYPGMEEKDSVPVILVHDLKESRKGFHDLALYLQARGCAVLVPDLRGHGESIRAEGVRNAINPDRMNSRQFQAIIGPQGDMEACKKFLMQKNNKGELNIEKLCVVGAGMGSIVATNWAVLDWSWPPLATGKQGQDVKALVLISPVWSSRGLYLKPSTMSPAFRSVFSTMILVGEQDKKSCKCANSLAKIIERFNTNAKAEDPKQKTFFNLKLDTSLKGMKMLDEKSLKVPERIAHFIKLRLIDQDILWKERKKPFDMKPEK